MVAEAPAITGRLLTFRVGVGRFAVPLEEVLGVQDLAVPGAVADRGVLFRGRPVTTVDARELWSSGADQPTTKGSPAAIIVDSGRGATALVVDCVERIVEGVEMRPLPGLVAAFVKAAFRGVTLHADGGRLLVDPAALSGATAGGGQGGPGEA
jgi:chemotaxis protein histidine kinase CheA